MLNLAWSVGARLGGYKVGLLPGKAGNNGF